MATSAFAALPVDGWRRARRCGPNGGNCVEINTTPDVVWVRDSKALAGPVLIFGAGGWRSFVSVATQGNLHP